MKGIAFKDRVQIQAAAGNGGDGAVSFRREKYVPRGGPDGGNGGNGGSILLRASKDVDSLVNLYYQPNQRAAHGKPGGGANRTGETGADLIIDVPCGTVAYLFPDDVLESGRPGREVPDRELQVLGEVLGDGETLLIAQGGRGGRGNLSFATSTNRAPRQFTSGTEGESRVLRLELRTVADIGLVGFPNAGKSTLLTALSHAHPKIGAYPFTTLNPIIGTVEFEDFTRIRIADIPGLITGAHEGVGLGHDFLRHIERSGLLIYIIDMAGMDGRDPVDDFRNLREELKLYREELMHRPGLVVANKMDLEAAKENLQRFIRETGITPVTLSAEQREGTAALKDALYEWKMGRRFFSVEA